MARLNQSNLSTHRTHEGAPAARIDHEAQLRRSLMSCLLWEDEFYEDGRQIGERLADLAQQVRPDVALAMAVEARDKLRHAPLWILAVLDDRVKGSSLLSDAVPKIVRRADELAEVLAMRCKITSKPLKKALSNAMRRGLKAALANFDEYQLAKYNRPNAIKLRDVARLVHAKGPLIDKLCRDELATPVRHRRWLG